MSILQKLNALKNNVFGGPGNTGATTEIGRKSAIELAKTNPLNGRLDGDPFQFTSMVYPQGMSDYKQEGQYIIFYINKRIDPVDLKSQRDAAKRKSDEAALSNMENYRMKQYSLQRVPNFDLPQDNRVPDAIGGVAGLAGGAIGSVPQGPFAGASSALGNVISGAIGSVPQGPFSTLGNVVGDYRVPDAIGDAAGPIYNDAKQAASLPNIGQITGGLSATAAAANQDSFRGQLTGAAAALVDSAASTRPAIPGSGSVGSVPQGPFASTAARGLNIGETLGSAATALNSVINFTDTRVPDAISGLITNTPNYGTARGFNIGQITNATVTPNIPRDNRAPDAISGTPFSDTRVPDAIGGYATAATYDKGFTPRDVHGEKLIVVNDPVRKPGKKQIFTNSEGTDLSLEPQGAKSGMNSYANLTTRIDTSIALYLPSNIQSDYGVKYNATETGTLGFLAAKGGNFIRNIRDNEASAAAGDITETVKDLAKSLGLKTVDELSSLIGLGEGAGELVQKFFGEATNPYMEVLFDNVEMRSFTYSFNFTPKSQKETQEIKDIIETFRFHMAPEMINDHGRYMTLPAEFDIHYMYQDGQGEAKENTYLNKIATCVLTSCNVNYTPNGVVQVHADGSPVSINMQLSFQETEMITKHHIKRGF